MVLLHGYKFLYVFFHNLIIDFVCVVVVILVRRVVVLSHYDGLVFVVVVRRLFVFERFELTNYIRLETKKSNQR